MDLFGKVHVAGGVRRPADVLANAYENKTQENLSILKNMVDPA